MFDIYVINLKEREDRMKKIMILFKDFNIIRVDAIKYIPGSIGCFLSHQKCIKIAKEKKLSNIMVIEDDCIDFNENFDINNSKEFTKRLSNIKNTLDNAPLTSWDIFLGGCGKVFYDNIIGKTKLGSIDLDFAQVSKAYGTHMICYNSSSYDFFLEYDPINIKPFIPIDAYWSNSLKALVCVPFIVSQDDGRSDIENRPLSYKGRIKSSNICLLDYIKK